MADEGDAGGRQGVSRVMWPWQGFCGASGKAQSMNVDLFISVQVRIETSRNKISPGGIKITRGRVQEAEPYTHPPTGGNQEEKLPEGKTHFRKRCAEWPQEGKQSYYVTGREWRPGRILVGGGGV